MLPVLEPAVEGHGKRNMVSAVETDSGRVQHAPVVNNDVPGVRIDHHAAAKSVSLCDDEPEQNATAVADNPAPVSDGPRDVAPDASRTQVSMEDVREAGFCGFHDPASAEESSWLDIMSRPIAWRLLLGVLSEDSAEWASSLRLQRAQYKAWKREYMGPRGSSSQSDDANNIELLKDIEKDICRTRSDLAFFAVGGMAHQWMLRILFVHAKLHPDVGYMQGMNEILAPILFAYGNDPSETWALETEADAFYSFQSIIASAKLLYLPAPSDPSKSGADLQMNRLMLLLRQHDPVLWQHLNSIGVTPDLFSFRWYMTLLGREFPMPTTLRIWDALLSDSKRFSLLHYANCALVRCRRSSLLRLGFAGALKCLQSAPPSGIDAEQLLRDAERMRTRDRFVDQARESSANRVFVHLNRS